MADIKYISDRLKNDDGAIEKTEDIILRKIEKILRILEVEEAQKEALKVKLERARDDSQKHKSRLKEKSSDIKILKDEINKMRDVIAGLRDTLDSIHLTYQESAVASVELLSDLEYYRYKSSFIDIDIKYSQNEQKIKHYGRNIRRFFLEELRCTYLFIVCYGLSDERSDLLKIKANKKLDNDIEFLTDQTKVYYHDLVDIDVPQRVIGRMIIGRYPYSSKEKEKQYDRKIRSEIDITRRLLEKSASDIVNKELAIKDALTGLYSRKYLEERLTEEFTSLDMYNNLSFPERDVLQIVMRGGAVPVSQIMKQYFRNFKTKDEVQFSRALDRLLGIKAVSKTRERYLGELEDHITFETTKKSTGLYVAMLDLDLFKDVNDNWGGHAVGDRILKEFAAIMKNHLRTMDIPVRYGGEEFIIIFPRSGDHFRILTVLDEIRKSCEKNLLVEWKGNRRNVTVSAGLTSISKYDLNIYQLINRADEALYRAKRGRNRIVRCVQEEYGTLSYS